MGPWNHENGVSGPEVFGVKIKSGEPFAHCWSCGYHGTTGELYQRVFGLNKIKPRIEAQWATARKINDAASDDFGQDLDGPGIEDVLTAKKGLLSGGSAWLLRRNAAQSLWPQNSVFQMRAG